MIRARGHYAAGGGSDATGDRHAAFNRAGNVAVIGSGISGLSCAWSLAPRRAVTLYERDTRLGGHSNTVQDAGIPVDTGFIVYNVPAYPNLHALLGHLGVETIGTDMSFAVSLDEGRLEYAGTDLRGLFAQRSNLARPRFWRMLAELLRFYRMARERLDGVSEATTLGEFLDTEGDFRVMARDHLLPMAAAIWSCPTGAVRDYPARAFLRFCDNHGLLQVRDRPEWRTIVGGSQEYVRRLAAGIETIRAGSAARLVMPGHDGVRITDSDGETRRYDAVVLACHAPDALALLPSAPTALRRTLAAFRTTQNHAVLHQDATLMPQRRAAWSSWNVIGASEPGLAPPCVTYWMNRLQSLHSERPLFVTLNPTRAPDPLLTLREESYAHPLFDAGALAAQRALWSMQGEAGLWFAGAWLGSGFHEDGLQTGLAVADALGGVRRPWSVAVESGRLPGPALTEFIAAP